MDSIQELQAALEAKDAEIARLNKCYDLAIKSRLEWREQAERLERQLAEETERCARVAETLAEEFLSPEYATGQPLSSFQERFACAQVAAAIRRGAK
jgi:hypothetical protein